MNVEFLFANIEDMILNFGTLTFMFLFQLEQTDRNQPSTNQRNRVFSHLPKKGANTHICWFAHHVSTKTTFTTPFLQQLIYKLHIMPVERRGIRALQIWCRRVTDSYENVNIMDMASSWRDGLGELGIFCFLLIE